MPRTPDFTQESTKKLWNEYFSRIGNACRFLDSRRRREIESGLREELFSSFLEESGGEETDRLRRAIKRKGDVESSLRSQTALELAGGLLLSPVRVVKSLCCAACLSVPHAIVMLLVFAGYLYSVFLTVIALLKPVFPDRIGFFRYPDGGIFFGVAGDPSGATDVLGYSFIPVTLIGAAAVYFCMTILQKRLLRSLGQSPAVSPRTAMRLGGRILAVLWAGFWLWFGFASGIVEELGPYGILKHTITPGGYFLLTVLVLFRWERAGAWLLLAAGVITAVWYPLLVGLQRMEWIVFVVPLMSLPPLLSGFLILRSCRRRRESAIPV